MGKTDGQTDAPPAPRQEKTSRWAFTAYQEQWHLFASVINPLIAEIGWQTEICPDTQREHYQGYIRTIRQVRFAQIQKIFPKVHLEPALNWDALLNYCKKPDSAVPGTQVHIRTETESSRAPMMSMPEALTFLASFAPYAPMPDFLEINPTKAEALVDRWKRTRFWDMVFDTLQVSRNLIAVYHQPHYIRCIDHTFKQWCEDAVWVASYADHPDRQTDNELPNNAFEN